MATSKAELVQFVQDARTRISKRQNMSELALSAQHEGYGPTVTTAAAYRRSVSQTFAESGFLLLGVVGFMLWAAW